MNLSEDILFSAFRYALGRMTYVVDEVADTIKEHAAEINPKYRAMMIREIEQAILKDAAGMEMDRRTWEACAQALRDSGPEGGEAGSLSEAKERNPVGTRAGNPASPSSSSLDADQPITVVSGGGILTVDGVIDAVKAWSKYDVRGFMPEGSERNCLETDRGWAFWSDLRQRLTSMIE